MSDTSDESAAAAWAVLERAAGLVARRSRRYTLKEACERLGVDVDRVRERAERLGLEADDRR